jgi:glutaryl-CoA dehydrogenase
MARHGFDFMDFESRFTGEERAVRDSVRRFIDEAKTCFKDHYERGTFPSELVEPLAELGVLGATIKGYGCRGSSYVAYGLMNQEIERGDSGLRSFASVQSSLVMYPIHAFGSEQQRKQWLPRLARGEAIGCFGLAEPDHGSDPGGLAASAVRDGGDFILNGTKMWITNGTIADVAIIWAKLDGRIHGFLVERGTPGFEAKPIQYKLSLRASDTARLVLNDCRIPGANLLPATGGLKHPLMCLNQARYGIAWGALGAATACLEEVLGYTQDRLQFRKPLASFQITQSKLADVATEIVLGQLLCLQLGRLKDEGKATAAQVSMAKRNNVHKALAIARTCRGMLGANGISGEYQTMRHMCNLETVETYEGTYEVHTLIIGRELTGFDAFV